MTSGLLPIGIQSFSEIRTKGYLYVDKTPFILDLARTGKYFFLSRPRRFGKSLFIDTLAHAFSGRHDLFAGLSLARPESGWDFSRKHPVLRIDFAGGTIRSTHDLSARLSRLLSEWEVRYGIKKTEGSPGERLLYLIPLIAESTGEQVVILVDEYDKPILDNLNHPDIAGEIRDHLRDFYGALKPLDSHLRFAFLTGVSKFAKTGIFSGLNNLNDITLDGPYSALCGYTDDDLDRVFTDWMRTLDPELVRMWYNGYSWGGKAVYNPFDILLLFSKGEFRPFWFETGTPSFLVSLLMKHPRSLPDLDQFMAGEELIGSFQVEDLKPETLLFQAGYLTIRGKQQIGAKIMYSLGFPNLEVKSSFSQLMLDTFTGSEHQSRNQERIDAMVRLGDTRGMRDVFHSFFASIPHDWYRKNQLSGFEGYYASIVYAYFSSLGYMVIPEDTTNRGRIDLTVQTPTGIWIFEFKVQGLDRTGIEPLKQLQMKGYAEKYQSDSRPVYEIGVIFDPDTRNIVSWEVIENLKNQGSSAE